MQLENFTRQKIYVCPLCKSKFKSKVLSDKHYQKHSENKLLTCEACHKVFSKKDSLDRHMKCHLGDNSVKCERCDITFANNYHLQRHLIVHIEEKPYVCELCNKNLSTLYSLKEHRLSHTGEKPYSCDVCNKGFVTSSKLGRHRRIHENDKPPFSLQLCDGSLSSTINRSRIHSENNPHVCEICNRRCKTSVDLVIHKHIHEKTKNASVKREAGALSSDSSLKEVVTYSKFMRKNSNTYGKRTENVAKDNS